MQRAAHPEAPSGQTHSNSSRTFYWAVFLVFVLHLFDSLYELSLRGERLLEFIGQWAIDASGLWALLHGLLLVLMGGLLIVHLRNEQSSVNAEDSGRTRAGLARKINFSTPDAYRLVLWGTFLGYATSTTPAWLQPSWLLAVISRGMLLMFIAALLSRRLGWAGPAIRLLRDPFIRASLLASALMAAAQLSGAAAAMGAQGRNCQRWPFCPDAFQSVLLGSALPQDWLYLLHILLIGFAGLFLGGLLLHAWKNYPQDSRILPAATLAAALFGGEILIGALRVPHPQPGGLMLLHALTSLAAWLALMVLTLLAQQQVRIRFAGNATVTPRSRRWQDFVALTKPFIVLLLLFTTFAGMLLARQGLPPLTLMAATLLAGALAAGGSGAINQYIDRDLDAQMPRTASRPIPAGRVFPAEGLAFGLGLLVAAFYLMARLVNLNAAFLSLAGMLYYLLVYSLALKRRTAWNIVIGGGAGAIPPLVGWSAVTGQLEPFAIGLFLIVFLWTPVHFWSLALVRQGEYAAVAVPMLPVVKGRRHTVQQILFSALLLVGFTWLVSLLAPVHLLYQVAALWMGVLLLFFAWRVWRSLKDQHAQALYRFSNIYLGLLFLAFMLDVFIH